MLQHELVVKSLRDVDALCRCGGWHYVTPAFDRDTDEELRARIAEHYHEHVVRHRRVDYYDRLNSLSASEIKSMVTDIHHALWDPEAEDYPDAEVSGADFIEAVSSAFKERGLGPVTEDQ